MLSTLIKYICVGKLALATMLGVALALGLFLSNVSYAQESEEDGNLGSFAPYPGAGTAGFEADASNLLQAVPGGSCRFETKGDRPHMSAQDTEVSAHGWWRERSPGLCPEYADVEVWLQAHWCDLGCRWRTIAHNQTRIRAGGGRGRRTIARHACASDEITGFRNVVDVDLVGAVDPPNRVYITFNLACRPTSS